MEAQAPEVPFEAEYALESSVRCGRCQADLDHVQVVRLLRRRVNFTSALPRRGYAVVCPKCKTVLPAIIG